MLVLAVATALLHKETHELPRHGLRVLHHAKAHDEPARVHHHGDAHEPVLHHKAHEKSVRVLHHAKSNEEPAEGDSCGCVPLGDHGLSAEDISAKGVPESYGAECTTHDLTLDWCKGEFKPAYCHEKWCYVSKDCAAKDKKESFFFDDVELYYSYGVCGGIDAYAAEACSTFYDEEKVADKPVEEREAECVEFSSSCKYNEHAETCQNKLCECTGSNLGLDTDKLGFAGSYGEICSAWDEESCPKYGEDGVELGLWCCKDWCYVDEQCPSAKASSLKEGLFYSYYACPDSSETLTQCEWKEPIDFSGKPVPLSSAGAEAMNEFASTALRCELSLDVSLEFINEHGGLDGFINAAEAGFAQAGGVDRTCLHTLSVRGKYAHGMAPLGLLQIFAEVALKRLRSSDKALIDFEILPDCEGRTEALEKLKAALADEKSALRTGFLADFLKGAALEADVVPAEAAVKATTMKLEEPKTAAAAVALAAVGLALI
jgi:hypothetical protein